MAEGMIGSLLIRVGPFISGKAAKAVCSLISSEESVLRRFYNEMRDISEELESIRGFLREAERFRESEGNIRNFVCQVRRVAFDIEDVVDEFTYRLGEKNRGAVAKTMQRIKYVKTWHKLTKRLNEIKVRLLLIQERRNRYDTSGIMKRALPRDDSWITPEAAHFVEEGELVGIDEEKGKLMELLNTEVGQCRIVSVWGMGGVGKTALVTHVYNTVKESYNARAWISVSQTWERDQLLRKILSELQREDQTEVIDHGNESMDYRSLVQRIHNYLVNKRYLIILDDVWCIDAWHCIKRALSGSALGSVILTTRIQEVALLAPQQHVIEIGPLNKDHFT